ncbi:MAG: tetratricopeptide repeat protein [Planctomycetota bacterium]|jgi:serine/threonine-protein kinase
MADQDRLDDHENVDDGLKLAFGAASGSVLDALESKTGVRSRVNLRDAPEDASPILRVSTDGGATDDSRYQIVGEIARGGVGVVYKGRDKDLGRDVALKVLRSEFSREDPVVQRFIEEAQVGGQLQHPGIVPIYGLGLQAEGLPYFAMKLVKGETLTALIEQGTAASALLGAFEQVAQTVAYAHSRGVIHRDLKPSNVMVGAFGEVQVVDWGFAKVLGREDTVVRPGETTVATVRTGAEGSQSVAGSVMGTPAYMPAEQAMGQVDELTPRADVFSLGAILCEILTGRPPYTGTMQDQLLAAAQSRLDDAHARLDGCSAPEAVKQLARDCMAPLPKDRPADAGVVAKRLQDHLASVEERARQAELDAVHATAETRKARRGRRTTIALAAVALIAVVGGGVGYAAWSGAERERASDAAAKVAPLLREATHLEGEENWRDARTTAESAVALAETGGADGETLAAARTLRDRIDSKADAADALAKRLARDRRFVRELDEIVLMSTDISAKGQDQEYRQAFKRYRVDPDDTGAAAALADFSLPVALATHVDRWTLLRHMALKTDATRLDALARALDADAWRTRLRDAVLVDDADARRKALRALAQSDDHLDQHPLTLSSLGRALRATGEAEAAVDMLRRACVRYPGAFWCHHDLATILGWTLMRPADAEPHARTAVALRPDSAAAWNLLGGTWQNQGKDSEVTFRYLRLALELDPRLHHAHFNMGVTLRELGRYDDAIEACKAALRIKPEYAQAHALMADALMEKRDYDGAVAAAKAALRIDPSEVRAHVTIGSILQGRRDFDGAIARFREALRIDPKNCRAYSNMAECLYGKGDLPGALAAYQEVFRIDPNFPLALLNYGSLISFEQGRHAEAIVLIRKHLELAPATPAAYTSLANAHKGVRDFERAEAAFKKAIELDPGDANASANYGAFLVDHLGRYDDAIVLFRAALRAQPDDFYAQRCIGNAYQAKGDFDQAAVEFRKAVRLNPRHAVVRFSLGVVLLRMGDIEGAIAAQKEALRLQPSFARARSFLAEAERAADALDRVAALLSGEEKAANGSVWLSHAELCARYRRFDQAARCYEEAFLAESALATQHRYAAACCAARAGNAELALTWLRAELERVKKLDAPARIRTLKHWLEHPDLASIRDNGELWTEVRELAK